MRWMSRREAPSIPTFGLLDFPTFRPLDFRMNQDNENTNVGQTLLLLAPSFLVTGWLKMRWWALLALVPGVGMLFLMQIYQASMGTNAASTMGLALGVMLVVVANLGIVFGWRGVMNFGMAYALMMCVLPLPTIIHAPVSAMLGRMASVDVEVLNLAGIPVEQAGREILVGGRNVDVVGWCRAQGTMQFTALVGLFAAWFALRGWGRRIALLVGAALLGGIGYFVCSLWVCMAVHGGEAGRPGMWAVWGGIAVGVAGLAGALGKSGKAEKLKS